MERPEGWRTDGTSLWVTPGVRVTFQRVPQVHRGGAERMRSHGALPLATVQRDVLVPVASSEAFWIGFDWEAGATACFRVAVHDEQTFARDAITGGSWVEALCSSPQNYVVCPPQRAVDGVTAGGGPRPFARTTRLPDEYHGCRNLTMVARRLTPAAAARAAETAASRRSTAPAKAIRPPGAASGAEFQGATILPDPWGPECWEDEAVTISIVLVSLERFREVTGRAPDAIGASSAYGGWRLP